MGGAIKHFYANPVGRDFAVGDIHGCFTELGAKLLEIGFDEFCDRLFSVGDLVDRGPESRECLRWLDKPWFHAVRGNHEQMAIEYAAGRLDGRLYAANGGTWFMGMTPEKRIEYTIAFQRLPIAMDVVIGDNLVGIVHADCPFEYWSYLQAALDDEHHRDAVAYACMWSRDRITHEKGGGVADLYALVVGHTPLLRMTSRGNVLFIDTGAVFGYDLTVINMTEMFK